MGTRTLTEVRLGAQGVDAGTNGTLYFDDFESRRFSYIGTLPDPGVNDPQATNAAGWFARTYQYSPTIPHAVTNVTPETGSPDTYSYDANGNMTCRVEGGVTFKQDYNAENRISAIHKLALSEGEVMNGNCSTGTVTESWLYGYDGDGVRVSTAHYTGVTLDSLTLYYMGGAYEVTGSQVKKYYSMAGQTVMRDTDGSLKYLLTDHLGSTSAVVDGNGNLIGQQRYLPFGEVRTGLNPPYMTQTDFTYTGQRNLSGTGLMDYKFRFYSPTLGRFISPDSIIPNPANPQAFNRFSYVFNRPIIFIDPSGHDPHWCMDSQGRSINDRCLYNYLEGRDQAGADSLFAKYNVSIDSRMTTKEKRAIMAAIYEVGDRMADERERDESAADAFSAIFDPISFVHTDQFSYTDAQGNTSIYKGGCKTEGNTIICASFTGGRFQSAVNNIVHELGHVFDPGVSMPQVFVDNRSAILHTDDYTGQWNQNPTPSSGETFGDFFVAWVFGVWGARADDVWRENPSVGSARHWMTTNMSEWIKP